MLSLSQNLAQRLVLSPMQILTQDLAQGLLRLEEIRVMFYKFFCGC